jgi:hypothetical protein
MAVWSQQYPGRLFMRHPGPADLQQFESEQGLQARKGLMKTLN